jgi:hypothetical protein
MIDNIAQVNILPIRSMAPALHSRKKNSGTDPDSDQSPDQVRVDLIRRVKARMRSGYYNTDEVVDDLSDSFAKAFDQRL